MTTAPFPQNLRALRTARGWTQDEAQQALTAQGVATSQSSYSRMEKGERQPRVEELVVLARIFETSVDAILGDPDELAISTEQKRVAWEYEQARAEYNAAQARFVAAQAALNRQREEGL